MAHYVGLDVSVCHTSICIVDDVGKVIREVPSELVPTSPHFSQISGAPGL
jgi:hypothetical protein